MTIYIVTHGATVHEFGVEADAVDYIRLNPEAVLTTEQRTIPEVDVNSRIEQCYKQASWQLFLDLVESNGISQPLLTHANPHIAMAGWNLYNAVLRLKNFSIYTPPLVPEYRTFIFLLNSVIYVLEPAKIEALLDILKQCNIILLNQEELVSNLKGINLLPSNYQY